MSWLSAAFHAVEPELVSVLETKIEPLVEKYLEQQSTGPEHDLIVALFGILKDHAEKK